MEKKPVKVTQKELSKLASKGDYTGTTIDPARRHKEHQRDGHKGVMYFAKTQNMKKAENRLLKKCLCPGNTQRTSNAPSRPGYVYLIKK